MVKLFSKNSNLCDHNSPTLQTDGQTDRRHCDRNTALCTKVHRAVKIAKIQSIKQIFALSDWIYHQCHWCHWYASVRYSRNWPIDRSINRSINGLVGWFVINICVVFTARCTLVQSAVLRSHVVCLSVCPSVCDVGGLWSHRLEFFENNFTV